MNYWRKRLNLYARARVCTLQITSRSERTPPCVAHHPIHLTDTQTFGDRLLGKMMIVNAPKILSLCWDFVSPMLDERTKSKIVICPPGETESAGECRPSVQMSVYAIDLMGEARPFR
jgi:hypothetical protein